MPEDGQLIFGPFSPGPALIQYCRSVSKVTRSYVILLVHHYPQNIMDLLFTDYSFRGPSRDLASQMNFALDSDTA